MAPEIASKNVFGSNIFCNSQTELSPEERTLSIGKAHDHGSGNVQRSSRIFDNGSGCLKVDSVVSDMNLASRKAEEAANRRIQASCWLQQMVGPLELPLEPSEEELRVCLQNGLSLCRLINKVHPGAVPKIVENFVPSSPMEGALSAFQYFENVRNFLVAIEDLKLPSFEASDLEQSSLLTGSVAKVVDCVLAIKAFHEWKQNGESAPWKLGVLLRSPGGANMCSPGPFMNGSNNNKPANTAALKSVNQPRKRWAHSEFEYSGEYGIHLPEADPVSVWIREISFKCTSPQPLLNLVRTVLDNKKPEEIPKVVEFMLRKVMEEFERRTVLQGEQVKELENILENVHKQDEPSLKVQGPNKCLSLKHEGLKVLFDQLQQVKRLKAASESTKQDVLKLQVHWKEQMEKLERHFQKLAASAAGYQKVLEENRQLYNQVQDLKGNIRVYCRIRPFLNGEAGRKGTVDYIGENGQIMIVNPKKQGKDATRSFIFNKVFGTSASQEEVFLDTQPLIRSVLDGYNVCIFAYGQTGSGKTYTMSGPNSSSENLGVNYRALNDLFQISQARRDVFKYHIGVQMIEIYNEQVRDLLTTDGANKKLEIRNNSQQNGLNVPDATMLSVNHTPDVLEVMKMGYKNRTVGSTALNERSSRSHSILTVHVKGTDMSSGSILRGCLHLVDLAGSERVDKSEATGERLKEAQHINKSLSALGDVISALIQKSPHIPYRNSKLTQLLQDALGGQAKTLMFVHINPDLESYGETMSTLKFAERVASVELGAARSNKECGEVRDLKEQITSLKDALAKKDTEIDRLSKLKSMKASSQQLSCNTEKLKTKPQRNSGEEQERSNETNLLDEADIFLGCFAEKFENEEALASPPTWECQAFSLDNQLKQAPSMPKHHLPHLKENSLDWESLSPETSVQVKHYKYKLPRRHEPQNRLILHQEFLDGSSNSSMPGTEPEDGLPKLRVDRRLMKNGFSESCETLALTKQTTGRQAVNSEESAPEHIGSALDVLAGQVTGACEFLQTSDGQKHNYHAVSAHKHHNTENQAVPNTFGREDETDFFESRKHYDTPKIAVSIDQGGKVFQMKNSPSSMKQPFKINKKRSPLQTQKPTNEGRLCHGMQTQSPLRRSLAFGTVVTPGVECFNVRRASLAEKASFQFNEAAFPPKVAALHSNGKKEVCQQLLAVEARISPRSSKRWI
ncbi:hypothetical protein O6H91_13G022400 [Diphasiastrum complanatum]|uniref:Uncharacterized protein n=2 Tax=Diphasiastrum complanatum TaxID=34168 RepID=A0ACC2BSW9_DIPCM|nr:hypothetical protein O6H91_13G022400 [Diphasiastrum complanatum]KAJ7532846.1 hypothetical protein O6H91_13G022400 [Diphasiastrum complanatum]